MTNNSVSIEGEAKVNVGGHIISGNFFMPATPTDISLEELQERLEEHRQSFIQYEHEIEAVAAQGDTPEDASIRAIAVNAARAKAYIDYIIVQVLNRGGKANTKRQDLDIDRVLTQAFERGRKKYTRQKVKKRLLLLSAVVVLFFIISTVYGSLRQSNTARVNGGANQPNIPSSQPQATEVAFPSEQQPVSQSMFVNTEALNVRAKPDASADIVGKIFRGGRVTAVEEATTDWVHITFVDNKNQTIEGWVKKSYLKASN